MPRRTNPRRSPPDDVSDRAESSSKLSNGRAAATCLLAGVALSLAFPEPDVFVLAWVAVAPALVVIPRTSLRGSISCGFALGIGFFGSLLAWISLVGWLAWALLVLLQSAFFVLFAVSWRLVFPGLGRAGRLLMPVALWIGVETLRGWIPLGGFAWGELAQSQHDQEWLLRVASVGGAHAVAALVAGSNAVLAEGWRAGAFRPSRGALTASLLCLVAAGGCLSSALLVPVPAVDGAELDLTIVQGNVPRSWTSQTYEKDLAILDSHVRLTSELPPDDADLVVWPESSVGIDLERDDLVREQVAKAARAVGVPMIVGGNLDVDAQRYKVMAFHVGSDGRVVESYQKTHLVPFGEYVPRREWLDFVALLDQVPRDAIPGSDSTLFEVGGGRVAPVLSFEADFSSVVRRQIAAGGQLLVVGTNTSTWGESWASAQHVAMSQVRAAENRVWVAHAALSGISAVIDPSGQVVQRSGLWQADTLSAPVRFARSQTIYTRLGDWVGVMALMTSGLLIVVAFLRRKRAR